MNNLENKQKFQMRYLIKERVEYQRDSWCSEGGRNITVQSKPILQYSSDGVEWIDVPIVIEKEA